MVLELPALGFSSHFEAQLSACDEPGLVPARIAAEHRGVYEVWSPLGDGRARLAGRLRGRLGAGALPGVGDFVALDAPPSPDRLAVVRKTFERRTVFLRAAAGRETRPQVVAANVDVVFVVCGLDEDFSLHRIERYLARVFASGALPVVVLTKADLAEDADARAALVSAHAPGVEVIVAAAPLGLGLAELAAHVGTGRTVALVGSSGAGKSTLVNALAGEALMATREVRASDGTGRHTTTHRQLVALAGGGLLLDTPGMRELELAGEAGLDEAFDDVVALAAGCRFTDCGHDGEPGCAVTRAVAEGELDPDRVAHFLRLRDEARDFERRRDARLSRADDRAWGRQVGKMLKLQVRLKRGG